MKKNIVIALLNDRKVFTDFFALLVDMGGSYGSSFNLRLYHYSQHREYLIPVFLFLLTFPVYLCLVEENLILIAFTAGMSPCACTLIYKKNNFSICSDQFCICFNKSFFKKFCSRPYFFIGLVTQRH